MRTVFEEEEEELAPAREQDDRELTLSSTTLLVIFFGLVLVCGLFFGLGYTLGRRSAPSEAERESGVTPTAQTSASVAQPVDSRPKPSAAEPTSTVVDTPAPTPDVPTTDTSAEAPSQPTATAPTPQAAKAAIVETKETKPAVKTAPPPIQATKVLEQPSAAAPAGIMVQIAAISNPADADVLIAALEKHGYTVAARHQANDTLIHVQVGPFATRAEAVAMRQKLLGDGYNAIIK